MNPRSPLAVTAAVLLLALPLRGDGTSQVSLTSTDGQPNDICGHGVGRAIAISADGNRVAFCSSATNMVPGDQNGVSDVFVRDLSAGTTTLVSVSTGGVQTNSRSDFPALSSDGRYVAFSTESSTLVAGDTNGLDDVFVRDTLLGITRRASVGSNGEQGTWPAQHPAMSADGRWLVFNTRSVLGPGDTNDRSDVYLRDLQQQSTERVSLGGFGNQLNGDSGAPAISADASTIAFISAATNAVILDFNGEVDVFVRDFAAGTVKRAGAVPGEPEPNGPSGWPSLSFEGSYVAFTSAATNLVPGDTNGTVDVFVQNMDTYAIERVSVGPGGLQANGESFQPWISADARFVVFESEASNLVPGDTNGMKDVFVHDRFLHMTRRVGVADDGTQPDAPCYHAAISYDGSRVVFSSWADLAPGATNPYPDVFLRTRSFEPDSYCFGGAALCPCGNDGGALRGCGNSTGAGALLGWSGSASYSADDLELAASSLPPNKPALAFAGSGGLDGAQAIPFGDGLRCVVGSTRRLGVESSSAAGAAGWGPGLNALGDWEPGATRYFQVWYRDPVGGPCGSGFNLTNGLVVQFGL